MQSKNTTWVVSPAAKALCFLRNMAFVPAPARSASVDPAVAAGAVVVATAPMSAEAFVFKGHLEMDRTGILGTRTGRRMKSK